LNILHVNPKLLSTGTINNEEVLTNDHLYSSFGIRISNKIDSDPERDSMNNVGQRKFIFQKWLKKLFNPSHIRTFGDDQLNIIVRLFGGHQLCPVLYFHLTKLSPGYIGGLISGLIYK